jgi:hypothetical protein
MRFVVRYAALVVALTLPSIVRAQGAGTTLIVGVADAESGTALENALVRLPDFAFHARTSGMGQARIGGVKAGKWPVEVRKLGYKPLKVTLAFSGKDSLDAVLMLERGTTTLDTVRVMAEAPTPPYLRAFETRRKMAVGRFRTRAEMLARDGDRPLADLLVYMFSGLDVERLGASAVVTSFRGGLRRPNPDPATPSLRGCPLQVFVDDQPLMGGDIGWIRTGDLAGVEFYSGDSGPIQYRRGPSCGVLLLWLVW